MEMYSESRYDCGMQQTRLGLDELYCEDWGFAGGEEERRPRKTYRRSLANTKGSKTEFSKSGDKISRILQYLI
jgi:hypothetical protein